MHAGKRVEHGYRFTPAFRKQRTFRLATPSSASAGALTKCGHRRNAGPSGRPPSYAGTSLHLAVWLVRRRPAYAMGPSHPLRAVTYTASFDWSGTTNDIPGRGHFQELSAKFYCYFSDSRKMSVAFRSSPYLEGEVGAVAKRRRRGGLNRKLWPVLHPPPASPLATPGTLPSRGG